MRLFLWENPAMYIPDAVFINFSHTLFGYHQKEMRGIEKKYNYRIVRCGCCIGSHDPSGLFRGFPSFFPKNRTCT